MFINSNFGSLISKFIGFKTEQAALMGKVQLISFETGGNNWPGEDSVEEKYCENSKLSAVSFNLPDPFNKEINFILKQGFLAVPKIDSNWGNWSIKTVQVNSGKIAQNVQDTFPLLLDFYIWGR